MQQVTASVVIIVIIIFLFIPSALLTSTRNEKQRVKHEMNLSARVLAGCIMNTPQNFIEISEGYRRKSLLQLEIDKSKLIRDFYEAMKSNIPDLAAFDDLKKCFRIKALVYCDKFLIADELDRWSPPYFFILNKNGRSLFVNTENDDAYYYDNTGKEVHVTLETVGVSSREKNDAIINRVNEVIAFYTSKFVGNNLSAGKGAIGLGIKIFNPENKDAVYNHENSYFNILEGITFFVVYDKYEVINVLGRDITIKNYGVVGYTLDDIFDEK